MPYKDNLDTLAGDIGGRIRSYRDEHGLQQKDLADGAGIPRSQLSRYESGEEVPRVKALAKIGLFIEHSLDWLVYGREHDRTMRADPVLRDCILQLEAASPHCRRSAIEMVHALLARDRAEARMLSDRNGQGSATQNRLKTGNDK